MNALMENFWTILVIGTLLTLVGVGAWLQTGKRALLIGGIVALLVMIGLLVFERRTLTEREKVEALIRRVAAEVSQVELDGLLSLIHEDATDIRRQASAEFHLYKIKQVTIKPGLKIDVDMKHEPPQAVASFNVVAVGGDSAGIITDQSVPRFVILTLQKEGDDWKVWRYEHHEPQYGMLQQKQ